MTTQLLAIQTGKLECTVKLEGAQQGTLSEVKNSFKSVSEQLQQVQGVKQHPVQCLSQLECNLEQHILQSEYKVIKLEESQHNSCMSCIEFTYSNFHARRRVFASVLLYIDVSEHVI